MQPGSTYFDDYSRTLRRVCWAELIDRQMMEARRKTFRASLVGDPCAKRPAQPNRAGGGVPLPVEAAATGADDWPLGCASA